MWQRVEYQSSGLGRPMGEIFALRFLLFALAGWVDHRQQEMVADTSIARETRATPRRVQALTEGDVIAFPEVGGLHHRYERRAT